MDSTEHCQLIFIDLFPVFRVQWDVRKLSHIPEEFKMLTNSLRRRLVYKYQSLKRPETRDVQNLLSSLYDHVVEN